MFRKWGKGSSNTLNIHPHLFSVYQVSSPHSEAGSLTSCYGHKCFRSRLGRGRGERSSKPEVKAPSSSLIRSIKNIPNRQLAP